MSVVSVKGDNVKLYKRRWIMLLLFSLSGLLCSLYQFTYAAIQDSVMKYYRIHQVWKLNLMSLSFMIAYVPSSLIATLALKYKGLKFSLTLGCMLNFLCGWIRFAGFKGGQEYFYWISFVGQCCGAIAQPFITNAITSMASNWFGERERTIATTIGAFANILGGGIAFGIAPPLAMINSSSGKDVTEIGMIILLLSQAAFASIMILLVVSIFRDKPPTPPTVLRCDMNSIKSNTIQDLKQLFLNPAFMILFIAFGVGFGVFQAFTSLINQIVIPVGYDDNDAGYMGLTIIAAGMIGAAIFGIFADLTKRYKLLLIICGLSSALSFVFFCIIIMYDKTPLMFTLSMLAIALMGLNATAVVPLALEAAVEVTYPISESLSNGLLYAFGTILSVICLIIMTALQQTKPSPTQPSKTIPGSMQNALWFALGLFLAAICLTPFFRGKYLRYERELAMKDIIASPTIQNDSYQDEERNTLLL